MKRYEDTSAAGAVNQISFIMGWLKVGALEARDLDFDNMVLAIVAAVLSIVSITVSIAPPMLFSPAILLPLVSGIAAIGDASPPPALSVGPSIDSKQ